MVFGIFILDIEPWMSESLPFCLYFSLHNDHTQTDKQMSVTISFLPRGGNEAQANPFCKQTQSTVVLSLQTLSQYCSGQSVHQGREGMKASPLVYPAMLFPETVVLPRKSELYRNIKVRKGIHQFRRSREN